ncbi:hypothetical protein Lal_00049444 [Lupinus albus]|uniref:Putative transcription factor TGA like domain-containing protein n=1 Tax=Lupinus albus TaxID=3870 RepID=A0A6A5M1H6_LUPAL|nr:putative transcription factor TGA like domain-containing protein [Lupinus albus]KAF1867017.1 hypothetical protein Lal_00049444 [Lupinus albus]
MSMLPSTATYLSQTNQNENFDGETFHIFFECWLAEQNQLLKELLDAEEPKTHLTDEELQALISKVVKHYEYYYKAKSKWAKQDVLAMLSPTWRSSLEEAFLWIGGWRPSMAFQLLYSKCGLQFEAKMNELIQGLRTCDLGDISATQLGQVDEMQRKTIREEREITDVMARHQETVADASMVELSHVVVAEMNMAKETKEESVKKELEEKVESTLAPKEEGLEEILLKADDLRMRTLKGIVSILTPKQGIHFLTSAAELHFMVHEWGKKKDARKGKIKLAL